MRPSVRILYLLAIWFGLGIFASFFLTAKGLWLGAGIALGVVLLLDALVGWFQTKPTVERFLPNGFALGSPEEVRLRVRSKGVFPTRFSIFDGVPGMSETEELPWQGGFKRGQKIDIFYPIKILERGLVQFTPTQILADSPLRFWQRLHHVGTTETVKVYPNYEPLVRFALLAMKNQESQMGIVEKRLGMSKEFHQLRDYQDGDTLNQIDWKATARKRELISREYREQRDQNVVFLVDCGRRMRAMDGEASQFDHSLNAVLLLSFIALRQGDQVGLCSFGGPDRWLPPVKGQHSMPVILDHLYDYQASLQPSDFSEAAERLMALQKRRSLVIVLTNLRSEDSSDFFPAMRLIRQRHLLLVASLKESRIMAELKNPIDDLPGALTFQATHLYLEDRRRTFEQLRTEKIETLDETAQDLPIALTNRYLRIKRSGKL